MNKLVGTLMLALMALSSTAFAQSTRIGDWQHIPRIDLITDENNSVLIARATSYPSYANNSGVVIRCSDYELSGVELYFNADKYLGSDDDYNVVYRVDGGSPIRGLWGSSTDNEAAFVPSFAIVNVVSALLDGKELIFRVTAYSTDYTYVVPISGLRQAIKQLGCYKGAL